MFIKKKKNSLSALKKSIYLLFLKEIYLRMKKLLKNISQPNFYKILLK